MIMKCIQFREVLDCYVNGELPTDVMAAADAHVHGCASCSRTTAHLNSLRLQVRRVVTAHVPPPDLEQRVRRSLRPRWFGVSAVSPSHARLAAAAAVLVAVGISAAMLSANTIRGTVADAFDRAAVRLAVSRRVDLAGTVLCRDCELHNRYGERVLCDRIGHHGAIATADGRLWNIVEQDSSRELIHDDALLGRKVHVRGRLFRDAGSIMIETYQFTDVLLSQHYRSEQ